MKAFYITNLGILENLSQTQILPYVEGLAKKGIELHIISFEKRENLKDKVLVENMRKRLGKSYIGWDTLTFHGRWGNLWDILVGWIKVFKMAKAKRVSVLHVRASIPVLVAWPIAKVLHSKIIYDRRGTMAGDLIYNPGIKNELMVKVSSAILSRIDRFIIRHSDAVVVLSKKAVTILKQDPYVWSEKKIVETIPCCVDMLKFNKIEGNDDIKEDLAGRFVIGYLGSLSRCYLLKEMIDFFKVLKRRESRALFFLISHSDKEFIDSVFKKEGLSEYLDYMVKNASSEEVPEYLTKCDCSIMFIDPVDCKRVASPAKFGEALAAGIPVITNKGIGDTEDIINARHIGIVVDGFNTLSYEKAISKILSLLDEKNNIKERCIETAERYFSLTSGIEKYAGIYSELCKIGSN